ncbi:hypothetical protein [Fulvivirga lutea]|uniref:Uncharacterized protein n=1 Tax=Fulvivirga lutea TaxID=2810512 RepID=A0A974WIJ4_9BACT|nr:hypothetical protein [Fulvivirga lutea]QSE99209.1 hypothetical protein JR347_09005 [Fulvivirga lutea]
MKPILSLFIVLCFYNLSAQSERITDRILSEKSINKVNAIEDPVKKLKKYKKLYSKDSAKQAKKERKYWRNKADSLLHSSDTNTQLLDSVDAQVSEVELNKVTKITNDSSFFNVGVEEGKEVVNKIEKPAEVDLITDIKPDSTWDDQLKNKAKEELNKTEKPVLAQELMSIEGIDITSGIDSANVSAVEQKGKQLGKETLNNTDEFKELNNASEQSETMKEEWLGQGELPIDSSGIDEEKLKNRAKEQAMKLATEQAGFSKIGRLKSKYSKIVNSNDLSSAVKRNSLEGEPIGDRLILGGNFTIVESNPLVLDLTGSIGYKLSKKWVIGLQASHRIAEADSISVSGGRLFANYDIAKNFFFASEIEMLRKKYKSEELSREDWIPGLFAGIGRKFKVFKNLNGQVALLYNFTHDNSAGVYNKPLVVRFGFNISK